MSEELIDGPPEARLPGDTAEAATSNRPFCVNHARVRSVYRCEICISAICATCAFTFPGNLRYCPACATAPRDPLSPARKRRVNASLGLGALATVTAIGCFVSAIGSNVDEKQAAALGGLFVFFSFIPAVVGFILALSSLEKRAPNTGRIWVGVTWNGLIVGLFLLMMVGAALSGND